VGLGLGPGVHRRAQPAAELVQLRRGRLRLGRVVLEGVVELDVVLGQHERVVEDEPGQG
jgi:hypothetical protein